MADAGRLVELFREACSLSGSERDGYIQRVRAEDPELGQSLAELLAQHGRIPEETGSFADRLKRRYGTEADPHITLEEESGRSDFASEVVQRLAGRGEAYGRYKLKGEVARGGQGEILRVWDEDLRRNLAMKVVLGKREATGETPKVDSRTLGRFLEEAQVTGQLDHPGIVPVHELGLDDQDQVYFTMKLVKGRDLKVIFDFVREGKGGWTQTRALSVLLKVCEAMAYAHAKGVIHRDLKPSNVMVGKYGEVYVMDWGLARVLGRHDAKDLRIRPAGTTSEVDSERGEAPADSPLITMEGDVVGTPAYMSPEQAVGDLETMGPQTDVYALGAMLYHLLSGQMPYVEPGMRLNNYAIWYQVQKGPPAPLHRFAPSTPPELVAITERAMERDPSKRYADMEALSNDLRAFLEHRVVAAYETGAFAELRKWVRRNRPLAASLAAGMVVLLIGLVAGWILEDQADRERGNVMRLSAFQRLDDLKQEAEELWPPWPEHLRSHDEWLSKASELVASVDVHRAQLAELEERALPYTEEDRAADRRSHPRYQELERYRTKLAALEAVQAVREKRVEVIEVVLDESSLPASADELIALARPLVHAERTLYGEERRGLALARLAMERVEDDEELVRAVGMLAWALHSNGLDTEALEEGAALLSAVPESFRKRVELANARLASAVQAAREGANREVVDSLRGEVDALASEVDERRTWRFEREEDRWWRTQLVKLLDEFEAFSHPETGLIDGISPSRGWGIARRQEWAAHVEELTVTGSDAERAWAEAITSIADLSECPDYGGLHIEPQLGLVPVGRDPSSGLWEFAHRLTGEVPERTDDGSLVLADEMGLVFVLLPGGRFAMGAQQRDPSGPNYDMLARPDEEPVHEVELSPFFFSKYEMTQGQWLQFTGSNPSRDHPERFTTEWNVDGLAVDLRHPVEQVDWFAAVTTLDRLGLLLPTEAQWEYGARGSTRTTWWTGNAKESLEGAANLADRYARDHGAGGWCSFEDWLDDGNTTHAGVGSYAPNPFGLHDVVGGVWEWCRDAYEHFYPRSPRFDPCCEPAKAAMRVVRGGCYNLRALDARSAERAAFSPVRADGDLGLRPVRAITGEIRYVGERK